jgi:hypothetical protein
MKTYTPVWNKYRPAILRMMIEAHESPQEYKLYAHEFKALNAKQKGGYNFNLRISKGKAINNIRDSAIAQDLLEILQLSKKASELVEESPYQIVLDKQFVLHISRITEPTPH